MSKGRVRIKICGMTCEEDIAYAATLGINAIGLVFWPKSPRFVALNQAKKLLAKLPPFMDAVAVLVNPSRSLVEEIINELPLSYLQFHGEESAEFCSQFKKPYIKALQADSAATIYQGSVDYQQASALLLDTPSRESYGGGGKTFDWTIIPSDLEKTYILAGGLHALNVNAALTQCRPYALDVCSGVEASLGHKDHEKMRLFVEAVWGRQ